MLNKWLVAYGNWLFHYRDKVFPVVLIALFAGFTPALFGGDLNSDSHLDVAGFMVAGLGQLYRWLVIGLAYIKRGGLGKRVYAKELVTHGFFAHVRNPLYGGNLMILAGLFVVHNNPAVYVAGGSFFLLAYVAIVAAEEEYLKVKFPEYSEYCHDVPRWIPHFKGLGKTISGMRFHWRRALLKDSFSGAMWLLTAYTILSLEAWYGGGAAALISRVQSLLPWVALTLVAPLTALVLKKRGLLNV